MIYKLGHGYVEVLAQLRGGKVCKDGYLTVTAPSTEGETMFVPASSVCLYIKDAAQALELANLFTLLSQELSK